MIIFIAEILSFLPLVYRIAMKFYKPDVFHSFIFMKNDRLYANYLNAQFIDIYTAFQFST